MVEEKLQKLEHRIVEYLKHAEMMYAKAINGIKNKNKEELNQIIIEDEQRSNRFEVKIEQLSTVFLAKFAPKASALRTVICIIKINNIAERIADHCVNISRFTLEIMDMSFVNYFDKQINDMLEISNMMLSDTITAYENNDSQAAYLVMRKDKEVNQYRDIILKRSIEEMIKTPDKIEALNKIINISRNVERISDLVKNICEEIIFKVDGEIIKHNRDEQINALS